jgi:hypothetical protein
MPVYLAEHSSVPLGKGEARQLVSFPEGTHEDVTRTFVNGGYRASQMYLPSRALNALIQSWQWVALVFSMATFLLVLGGLHRRRLQQVERQFNMRLEERLHERTRIARDLHDTLLQSFQGLLLRFDAATNLLPGRPEEARTRLESAMDRAEEAITEGRDAVRGLRSSTLLTNDLARAIDALGEAAIFYGVASSVLHLLSCISCPASPCPASLSCMASQTSQRGDLPVLARMRLYGCTPAFSPLVSQRNVKQWDGCDESILA